MLLIVPTHCDELWFYFHTIGAEFWNKKLSKWVALPLPPNSYLAKRKGDPPRIRVSIFCQTQGGIPFPPSDLAKCKGCMVLGWGGGGGGGGQRHH